MAWIEERVATRVKNNLSFLIRAEPRRPGRGSFLFSSSGVIQKQPLDRCFTMAA
jgi:hypothetical protein